MKVTPLLGAAIASLALLALPSAATAEVKVPASLVALVVIENEPGICHRVLRGLQVADYEIAEVAFEIGYGEHKQPPAAAVFHSLVIQCRARG